MRATAAAIRARALRTRPLVRAPIWFFRHGLGPLLGPRVMLLEHRGRRTGKARYVCLEVVERPSPLQVVVVSGFGSRSQWLRNLRACPDCHVTLGRRRRRARARLLPEEECRAVLQRYERAHPRTWRRLKDTLEHVQGGPIDLLPVVELTMSPGGTPD